MKYYNTNERIRTDEADRLVCIRFSKLRRFLNTLTATAGGSRDWSPARCRRVWRMSDTLSLHAKRNKMVPASWYCRRPGYEEVIKCLFRVSDSYRSFLLILLFLT